jgi:hypothetical protein
MVDNGGSAPPNKILLDESSSDSSSNSSNDTNSGGKDTTKNIPLPSSIPSSQTSPKLIFGKGLGKKPFDFQKISEIYDKENNVINLIPGIGLLIDLLKIFFIIDKDEGIEINDEIYDMPDFSFSPPPPDPSDLIDRENESPPPAPSTQISTSSYNPRKDRPQKKSEEERKIQKEEEEPNILNNINFSVMMSQMCTYLEKKYKLTEGLFYDLLKIFLFLF